MPFVDVTTESASTGATIVRVTQGSGPTHAPPVRLGAVHIDVDLDHEAARPAEDGAMVRARAEVVVDGRSSPGIDLAPVRGVQPGLAIELEVDGITVGRGLDLPAGGDVQLTLRLPHVQRWWPRSLGSPARSSATVRLLGPGPAGEESVAMRVLDEQTSTIGFRSIEIDTTPDATGAAFTLVVNGVPMFARGVQWRDTSDSGTTDIGRAAVQRRVEAACDAHVDLVRTGDGADTDDLLDVCDELGLLVWHDLAPAAATAANDSRGRHHHTADDDRLIERARRAVARRRHHPCLALWCGRADAPRPTSAPAPTDLELHALPLVVDDLDPNRAYVPRTQWRVAASPAADAHGCGVVWQPWRDAQPHTVRERATRFVAAVGWPASLDRSPTGIHRSASRRHQRAQAETARLAIEHLRSMRGWCAGAVWWRLDGCSPTPDDPTSWSLLDPDGRPLPAWYAVRDAYADRLLTVQPRGHDLVVHAVNDGRRSWWARGQVRRIDVNGRARSSQSFDVVVAPRSVVAIPVDASVATPVDRVGEVVVAAAGSSRTWWWFDERTTTTDPGLRWEVRRLDADRAELTVTAGRVARDLIVHTEQLSSTARADRQLVSLLPHTPEQILLTGLDGVPLDPDDLASPHLISTAATPH